LDNFFRKLKNSSFLVRLDVEKTHIDQKIEIFENPTSACQTIVRPFRRTRTQTEVRNSDSDLRNRDFPTCTLTQNYQSMKYL
jgi:hypothetical protein